MVEKQLQFVPPTLRTWRLSWSRFDAHRNEDYLKAMFNSGVKAMPKFNFNFTEKEALVQFFKEVNQTGFYPNTEAELETDGWVSINRKE